MKLFYLRIFASLSLLVISGCSPVKTGPQYTYLLNTVPSVPQYRQHSGTILVLPLQTLSTYNTTQMAYMEVPYRINYFGVNAWAEPPGQMLLPLIVQTLQKTHYFRAVVAPPYTGDYEYVLNTQILQLQQDFTQRPVVLSLIVRAQLLRTSTNQVVATQQFTLHKLLSHPTPYAGVLAANQATAELLQKLAAFCVTHAQ